MEQILDSGDKDALQELEISPGYLLVEERIGDQIKRLQASLERDLDIVATAKVRGQIVGLRTALSIPQILISEVRK